MKILEQKMCEYCEGISNPISNPFKIKNRKKTLENQIVYFGFRIEGNNLLIFIMNDCNKTKEILLEREIKFCPMCGRKLV